MDGQKCPHNVDRMEIKGNHFLSFYLAASPMSSCFLNIFVTKIFTFFLTLLYRSPRVLPECKNQAIRQGPMSEGEKRERESESECVRVWVGG